jgi:hypothetical protein
LYAHDLHLGVRDQHVVLSERNTGPERVIETEPHDAIAEDHGLFLTTAAVNGVDECRDGLFGQQRVDQIEAHPSHFRQQFAQEHATRRGLDHLGALASVGIDVVNTALDFGVQRDRASVDRLMHLCRRAEQHALTRLVLAHQGNVVQAKHNVLARHDDRLSVGRVQDVVGGHHQHARLELRLE